MDARVKVLNKLVKSYDKSLFSKRDLNGHAHIYRKKYVLDRFEWSGVRYFYTRPVDDHILALTDNWNVGGVPVEWGLDNIWNRLSMLDTWRDDTRYDQFCNYRQRVEEDKKRQTRNDFRARAADLRKDFAKATNDIVVRK